MPAAMSFYSGYFDDAGPLAANSNNGGTSYACAPVVGYDTAVNAIRLRPQGSMAANSSFSIRFRTRIN